MSIVGSIKSPAKARASRENGKAPCRPGKVRGRRFKIKPQGEK